LTHKTGDKICNNSVICVYGEIFFCDSLECDSTVAALLQTCLECNLHKILEDIKNRHKTLNNM